MKRSSHRSDCASLASSDTFFDDNSSAEMDTDNKRKSRNLSEKKRRDQFNVLVNELCSMVRCEGYVEEEAAPGTGSGQRSNSNSNDGCSHPSGKHSSLASLRKMDKSSVLRSTIDFLKLYYDSKKESKGAIQSDESLMEEEVETNDSWKPPFLSYEEFGYLMLDALDAFIVVLDPDVVGTITYASESILSLLGYNHKRFFASSTRKSSLSGEQGQEPLVPTEERRGREEKSTSIYDLVHESDQSSFRSLLHQHQHHPSPSYLSAKIHMKRNRSYPVTYESIRLLGSFSRSDNSIGSHRSESEDRRTFVAIGRLQTPQILKELRLIPTMDMHHHLNREFASRHSLEWKFLFLDHRASSLIGYMPFEVLGTSGYDYYHWDDLAIVVSGHEQLMQRGEGTSQQYRFLTKGQQWIWIKTRSYITYHQWNSKPEFIVCTHTITGFDEESEEQQNRRMVTCDQRQGSGAAIRAGEEYASQHSHPIVEVMDLVLPSSSISGSSSSGTRSDNRIRSHQSTKRRYEETDGRSNLTDSMVDSTQFLTTSSGYASRTGSSCESQSDTDQQHRQERSHISLPSESLNSLITDPCTYPDPVLTSQQQHLSLPGIHHHFSYQYHHQAGFMAQSQAQTILKKKHSMLQAHIQQQQQELRRMEEQLFNATFHPNSRMTPDDRIDDQLTIHSPAVASTSPSSMDPVTEESGIQHPHQSSSSLLSSDAGRSFIQLTTASKCNAVEMDQEEEYSHHHMHDQVEGQTMMCEADPEEQMFTWNMESVV